MNIVFDVIVYFDAAVTSTLNIAPVMKPYERPQNYKDGNLTVSPGICKAPCESVRKAGNTPDIGRTAGAPKPLTNGSYPACNYGDHGDSGDGYKDNSALWPSDHRRRERQYGDRASPGMQLDS